MLKLGPQALQGGQVGERAGLNLQQQFQQFPGKGGFAVILHGLKDSPAKDKVYPIKKPRVSIRYPFFGS